MYAQKSHFIRSVLPLAVVVTWATDGSAIAQQHRAQLAPTDDNFVWRMQPDTVQNPLGNLVIKGESDTYIRKGYLKFVFPRGTQVVDAAFSITFRQDGGTVGSHQFEVYSITDESLDQWNETTITWNNAPANVLNDNTFDPGAAILVGAFTIPPNTLPNTTFVVQSAELREAINADANGSISILIRRSTRDAQAHVFFSSETGESGITTPKLMLSLVRPWISVSPTCPTGGPIVVSWIGVSPNQQAGLLFSRTTGMFEIPPAYPCEGAVLGLSSSGLRVGFRGNGGLDGSRTLSGNLGPQVCDAYLQLLDLGDCSTSNVVQVR